MTQPKEPQTTERELLERVTRALCAVLCESNGLGDNVWRLKNGTEIKADWPWGSFNRALDLANKAFTESVTYLGEGFDAYD